MLYCCLVVKHCFFVVSVVVKKISSSKYANSSVNDVIKLKLYIHKLCFICCCVIVFALVLLGAFVLFAGGLSLYNKTAETVFTII